MRLEEKSVLNSKIDLNRSIMLQMYKTLCVSRGFSQQKGEYYDKTLTLVIGEIVPVFMNMTKTTMIHI
jgi:hypothetical protein